MNFKFCCCESIFEILPAIIASTPPIFPSMFTPIVTNPLRWDALSTSKQNEWKAYRTALLDITAQSGAPQSVTWPTKPS